MMTTATAPTAGSGCIPDVSPDFRWNRQDAKIMRKVTPHEATPQAIRVFNHVHRRLSDYGYWFLLGTLWVSYTGWSDLELWKRLFRSTRPRRETSLMKPSELGVYRALPDMLTFYRAHRHGERDWVSYTLDPLKAAMFAVQRGVSEVVEYRAAKADALCLLLRRGESEVLILDQQKAERVCSIEVQTHPGYVDERA